MCYHDKVDFSDSIPEEGGGVFLASSAYVQINSSRTVVLIRMYNLERGNSNRSVVIKPRKRKPGKKNLYLVL